jgi:hypothetical protein
MKVKREDKGRLLEGKGRLWVRKRAGLRKVMRKDKGGLVEGKGR